MATVLDLSGMAVPFGITPPAAMLSTTARFSFTFTTTVASSGLTNGLTYGLFGLEPRLSFWEVVMSKDGGGNVRVQLTTTAGVGPTIFSSVLTWSANQAITVTLDFSVCSLTVSGATTGNGTVTGAAFTVGSGSLASTLLIVGARLASGQSPPNWGAGSTLPGSISSVTDDAVTPVTDPLLYWAPYVWTSSNAAGAMGANNVKAGSTHVRSTHRGAYLRLKVTVDVPSGPIALNCTPSRLGGGDSTLIQCLTDGATSVNTTLTNASSTAFTLSAGLSAGTHTLYFWIENHVTQSDRWTTPTCAVEITSIKFPPGVKLAAQTLQPKNMLVLGDSISDVGQNSWYQFVAAALECEVGSASFQSQGYNDDAPGNNVPDCEVTWSSYDATQSRLVGGLLVPQPDYIIVSHGQNDTVGAALVTAVQNTLAAIAAAAPRARIVCNVPFSGACRASLVAATKPSNCVLTDTASEHFAEMLIWYTSDNIHPTAGGMGLVAAELLQKIRNAYGSFGTFGGRRL